MDPDGRDIWEINSNGKIRWVESSEDDRLYKVDGSGSRTNNYITVDNKYMLDCLSEQKDVVSYSSKGNIDDMLKLFKFVSDNTAVEWALHRGRDNTYTIGTKHLTSTIGNWEEFGIEEPLATIHSHPDIPDNVTDEEFSMGFIREGENKARAIIGYDWHNVRTDINKDKANARKSYVYFPISKNIYFVT